MRKAVEQSDDDCGLMEKKSSPTSSPTTIPSDPSSINSYPLNCGAEEACTECLGNVLK